MPGGDTGVARWCDHLRVRHLYECQLRWADQDMLGHVNNVLYLDYLQEARVDLFRVHAPDLRAPEFGEGLVVVRHDITYVSPLVFSFKPAYVETWVSDIRAASFTLDHEIFSLDEDQGRIVHVRARSVLTPFDFTADRPRRLSAPERAVLGDLLEQGEELAALPVAPPIAMPGDDYRVGVRFSDLDVYRHVNNVTYFEYFQESRIKLMRELGRGLHAKGLDMVVARTRVDYLAPMLHRAEPYDCPSWIGRLGRTSVSYESLVREGDRVLARANVIAVCVSSQTHRPLALPTELRERVEPLLAQA